MGLKNGLREGLPKVKIVRTIIENQQKSNKIDLSKKDVAPVKETITNKIDLREVLSKSINKNSKLKGGN